MYIDYVLVKLLDDGFFKIDRLPCQKFDFCCFDGNFVTWLYCRMHFGDTGPSINSRNSNKFGRLLFLDLELHRRIRFSLTRDERLPLVGKHRVFARCKQWLRLTKALAASEALNNNEIFDIIYNYAYNHFFTQPQFQ